MNKFKIDFKILAIIGLLLFIFLLFCTIASLYNDKQPIQIKPTQLLIFNNTEVIQSLQHKQSMLDISSQIFIVVLQSIDENEAEEKIIDKDDDAHVIQNQIILCITRKCQQIIC